MKKKQRGNLLGGVTSLAEHFCMHKHCKDNALNNPGDAKVLPTSSPWLLLALLGEHGPANPRSPAALGLFFERSPL